MSWKDVLTRHEGNNSENSSGKWMTISVCTLRLTLPFPDGQDILDNRFA